MRFFNKKRKEEILSSDNNILSSITAGEAMEIRTSYNDLMKSLLEKGDDAMDDAFRAIGEKEVKAIYVLAKTVNKAYGRDGFFASVLTIAFIDKLRMEESFKGTKN